MTGLTSAGGRAASGICGMISAEVKKKKTTAKTCKRQKISDETGWRMRTFLLHVKYRQNATWQGQITWKGEEKLWNFEALELLVLLTNVSAAYKVITD